MVILIIHYICGRILYFRQKMNKIKTYYINHPLKSILILAFAIRLIAAIFSQGYGFSDDHFLVIEPAQAWVNDNSWNDWMPKIQEQVYPNRKPVPEGHSLVYPGIHYVLFSAMEFVGIYNPKAKMFLIRLIHALFSLLVVFYGYKIAKHYTNDKIAKQVGLILSLLWVMPILSVHNLVEMVCVPFIMWGLWLLVKQEGAKYAFKYYFLAGLIITIAVSIRFQTSIIVGGAGLVLLFKKQWKAAIAFGVGAILSFAFLQSIIDVFVWGRPFAEFMEYVRYNIENKTAYGHNIWYMYTTVIGGLVIPPLSLFLFFGWFNIFRKYPLLFWPSFLFFAFHNYFPNKQERFILPILPLFILAGVIGWWTYMDKSAFWGRHKKLFKPVMVFFWTINFIALPVFSTTYSKRSRCETMVYLGKQTDANTILVEESIRDGVSILPMFYGVKEMQFYQLGKYSLNDSVKYSNRKELINFATGIKTPQEIEHNNWPKPDYIVFINENSLQERVDKIKKYYPDIEYVTTINPSYIDLLMKKITPSNNNQLVFIYKLNKVPN